MAVSVRVRFVWSPSPRSGLIIDHETNRRVLRSLSRPTQCRGDFAVEIELKRSAKSVIERIVHLRDSL